MKQWYAKELSQLTQVSVRTLHYYDKIGLLKPSMRLSNDYRLYSEKDLLKLQQIIALKFFGFELSQIKLLLGKQENVVENLAMQSKFLQEKADALQEASMILKRVTESCGHHKSIPWENVIQLIEVYQMTQQLEHAWVKEIFTPDELKQYVEFEKEMKTTHQKAVFEKNWQQLVEELKSNLHHDPESKIGIDFGKKYMDWVNGIYGKKYAHLRTKKWEQGFGEGKGLDEIGLTPELLSWIEKAVNAYYKARIHDVLGQVGTISSSASLKLWNEVLDDMYGDDKATKEGRTGSIIEMALQDGGVSQVAKDWLRSLSKS
jgi:DNA-binding transcriptional MerR regulator